MIRLSHLLVIAGLFFSCNQKQSSNEQQGQGNGLISVEQLSGMLANDIQLIDVRTPEEYNNGHIKGSVNINFYDEDFAARINGLDKTKSIVVYCAVGGRSGKACKQVQDMGFENYFDLKGGIKAWKASDMAVE